MKGGRRACADPARPHRASAPARALRRTAVLLAAASVLAATACASQDNGSTARDDSGHEQAARQPDTPPAERDPSTGGPSPPTLSRATCPPDAANCRSATGRVLYVERVDPDGDGDAHFVLASRQSVTAPGISVVDVKRSLRPSPLPGPGDRLSAAGPVYRGSYGQRQIEAIELNVARAR